MAEKNNPRPSASDVNRSKDAETLVPEILEGVDVTSIVNRREILDKVAQYEDEVEQAIRGHISYLAEDL